MENNNFNNRQQYTNKMKKGAEKTNVGMALLLGNFADFGDKDMVTSLGGIASRMEKSVMDSGTEDLMNMNDEDSLSSEDSLISDGDVLDYEQENSAIPSRYLLSNNNNLSSSNTLFRFSELFGANESRKSKYKVLHMKGLIQKLKEPTRIKTKLGEDDDDEDIFFENDILVPTTKKTSLVNPVTEIKEKLEGKQNDEERKREEDITERCSFHNLDQVHWENDIVWDICSKNPQERGQQAMMNNQQTNGIGASMFQQVTKKINQIPDLSGIPKFNQKQTSGWGLIVNETDNVQNEKKEEKPKTAVNTTTATQQQPPQPTPVEPTPTQKPIATTENEFSSEADPLSIYDDKPKRKYTRRRRSRKEAVVDKFNPKLSTSAKYFNTDIADDEEEENQMKFLNENLMNDDWMDDIYWDDMQPKHSHKLLMDMNDKSMFLTEGNVQKSDNEEEIFETVELNIKNIANDSKYEQSKEHTQQSAKQWTVKHSPPALRLDSQWYKTQLTNSELRKHHHKPTVFKSDEVMGVYFRNPKTEKKKARRKKDVEKKQDLSANDHRVILMEYVEERPPLLNNIGMGSLVMNYYKKPNSAFDTIPECEDGVPIVVESEDSVPLISTLVDGEYLTTVENNMYRAQIYKNDPKTTDFLLCTRVSSTGKNKFYIREIPRVYTVGHTQPKVEVTPPRSRDSERYTINMLLFFIYSAFLEQHKKGKKNLEITIKEIQAAFPDFPSQTIRQRLGDIATYNKSTDVWKAKQIPNEDEIRKLVSPEMVELM